MLNCNDFPYDRQRNLYSNTIQASDTLSIYSMFTFMLGLISSFYMQEIAHHAWFFNPINFSHLSCLSYIHTHTWGKSMNDMWTDVIYIQFWSIFFFFILIFLEETKKKSCVCDKLFYFSANKDQKIASILKFERWFPAIVTKHTKKQSHPWEIKLLSKS